MRRLLLLAAFLMTGLALAADQPSGQDPNGDPKAGVPEGVTAGMAEVAEPILYYEMTGKGEPVVFIHGGQLDRRLWDDQFQVFAK